MDQRALFKVQAKRVLKPALVADGFRASGVSFRRVLGDVIQIVKIQGSIYGGQCCVCLGIHLAFLPTMVNEEWTPDNLTEPQCEFRSRLTPLGQSDHWWGYGATEGEARLSAESILQLYQTVGRPYFECFSTFPDDFVRVTPAMLADGGEPLPFPRGSTIVRRALALSRIALYTGRNADAKAFAEFGLAQVGPAFALKHEFLKILGIE